MQKLTCKSFLHTPGHEGRISILHHQALPKMSRYFSHAIFGFGVFALACTNVTAQSSGISDKDAQRAAMDAKYYEWKRRMAERQIDATPLQDSLLKVGGKSLDREKNWEKLPKSFLIAVEVKNAEAFNGFGNSGASILAKWKKAFEEWCESAGGKVQSDRHSPGVVRKYLDS